MLNLVANFFLMFELDFVYNRVLKFMKCISVFVME